LLPLAEGAAPAAGLAPGRVPPSRAPLPRCGPRWVPVAGLGFRRPACSPLAVVASELTLGATACESRGQACGNADMVARQPSSKQKQTRPGTRAAVDQLLGTYGLRRQKPGGRDKNAPT